VKWKIGDPENPPNALSETRLDKALDAMKGMSSQIRPEHITQILQQISQIIQARLEADLLENQVTQRIRALQAQLHDDLTRTDKAAEYLRQFKEVFTREEQATLAAAIIQMTLGLGSPPAR
jgi:ABC-type hemin transport system substrate-binding protein